MTLKNLEDNAIKRDHDELSSGQFFGRILFWKKYASTYVVTCSFESHIQK